MAGNNNTLYAYVNDPCLYLDYFGLNTDKVGRYHGPKPRYTNPGHHQPGHPNFRGGGSGKTSILPSNAEKIYKNAIPDAQGVHWYALDESGEIHRFGNSNDGTVHWNGSSNQGRGIVVPPEVNKRFKNPNQRKAPKANYCK